MAFTCSLISSTFTQFDGSAPHVTMKVVKNSWITTKKSLIDAIANTLISLTLMHIAKRGTCNSPHLNRRISQNCFGGGGSAMQPEIISDNHKLVSDYTYIAWTAQVEKFDPDVFRQLMEFAHTGRLDLQPRLTRRAWRTLMTMMVIIKLRTTNTSVAAW